MKSFLAGRPQHDQPAVSSDAPAKAMLVRTTQPSAGAGGLGALGKEQAHTHASPNVECIKQGDKVVRLVVTCACGERIEIDCLYPNAS